MVKALLNFYLEVERSKYTINMYFLPMQQQFKQSVTCLPIPICTYFTTFKTVYHKCKGFVRVLYCLCDLNCQFIYILISAAKTLGPFIQKLRGQKSMKFDTLIVYT